MIDKILVALDGTESSEKTLDYAIELTEQLSAKLSIMSVIPSENMPPVIVPFGFVPAFPPASIANISKQLSKKYEEYLTKKLVEKEETNPDLDITAKLAEGKPAETIIETAEIEDFDLVIVGDKNVSSLKKLFSGSVSDSVKNESEVPVLIVK
jgi:nucleotide-binding universal stress UspA family protein